MSEQTSAYLQLNSPLFKLPPEIRREVYDHLFSATCLMISDRELNRPSDEPPMQVGQWVPNALAVLRSCRRIKDDIGDTWISKVIFHFDHPATMLRTLTALPPPLELGNVRRICVPGEPEFLITSHQKLNQLFQLPTSMKMLANLRLEELFVTGPGRSHHYFSLIGKLIQSGTGFEKLYFITKDSAWLSLEDRMRTLLKRVDRKQNGSGPGTCVRFFRATVPDSIDAVLHPKTRVQFEPADNPWQSNVDEASVMDRFDHNCATLTIVSRGQGAGHEAKKDPAQTCRRFDDVHGYKLINLSHRVAQMPLFI